MSLESYIYIMQELLRMKLVLLVPLCLGVLSFQLANFLKSN